MLLIGLYARNYNICNLYSFCNISRLSVLNSYSFVLLYNAIKMSFDFNSIQNGVASIFI